MNRLDPLFWAYGLMAALAVSVGVLLWLLWRKRDAALSEMRSEQTLLFMQQLDSLRQQMSESLGQGMSLITQQMAQVTQQVNTQMGTLNQQLAQTSGNIGLRLDHAAKVVGEVRQNLGELSQAAERIFEVGKDISSLQEILKAPKLRGTLGELFLGDLLAQVLPSTHFTLQYGFRNGAVVDAVIHLGQGLVPVDSKFPLENFRRLIESKAEEEKKAHRKRFTTDLKRHIDLIANKYILPDEGTFDFALMYIPAENVFYETMIHDESFGEENGLSVYALGRRVIPVSPNSFYAYLQAIVLGLKGLRIEKNAQEIIRQLGRLHGDFARFREDFEVLGKHLYHTRNRYDEASRHLERFGDKLVQMDVLGPDQGRISSLAEGRAPSAPEQEEASQPADEMAPPAKPSRPGLTPAQTRQTKLL